MHQQILLISLVLSQHERDQLAKYRNFDEIQAVKTLHQIVSGLLHPISMIAGVHWCCSTI